jgi:hypothetical protein
MILTAGNAGTIVGAGTVTVGGAVNITGGVGTGGTPTVGGAGGVVNLTAGAGGAGTTGGAGGKLTIGSGAAGAGGAAVAGALSIKVGATEVIGATAAQGLAVNVTANVLRKIGATVGGEALNDATIVPTVALDPSGSVFLLTHATPVITLPTAAAANAGVVWTFVNGGAGTTNFTVHGETATDLVATCLDTSSTAAHNLYWSDADQIIGMSATFVSTGVKWILIASTLPPTTHD